MNDDIPILFKAAKLQVAFEHYWRSMKCINKDFDPKTIEAFFVAAINSAEKLGYIVL